MEGFKYGKDIKKLADEIGPWNEATLDEYLTNPKDFIKARGGKKSKMTFKLKKEGERAAVIEYLTTLK